MLVAGLVFVWNCLVSGATLSLALSSQAPIARLAMRNGARNPGRSTLTVGLIGAASFLIVALSAFRLDSASEARGRDSGSGGFDLVAQSDQPIYQDLATIDGRDDLGFSDKADKLAGSLRRRAAARARRRRRQLSQSLSADRATAARRDRFVDSPRRLCLGRRRRLKRRRRAKTPGCCSTSHCRPRPMAQRLCRQCSTSTPLNTACTKARSAR